MNKELLYAELLMDEGKRSKPYHDTVGKITIGIGRNLSDIGLREDEIQYLFNNDVDSVILDLNQHLPWWLDQPEPVQRALANLCFNLGITKLLKFKNTLSCIKQGEYTLAVENLKKSKWFKQVQRSRSARIFKLLMEGYVV